MGSPWPRTIKLVQDAKNESASMATQLVCRESIQEACHSRDDDGNDCEQRSTGKPPLAMVHVQDLDVLR